MSAGVVLYGLGRFPDADPPARPGGGAAPGPAAVAWSFDQGTLTAAYDEALAAPVRASLDGAAKLSEREMIGGLCFTLRGHMV